MILRDPTGDDEPTAIDYILVAISVVIVLVLLCTESRAQLVREKGWFIQLCSERPIERGCWHISAPVFERKDCVDRLMYVRQIAPHARVSCQWSDELVEVQK